MALTQIATRQIQDGAINNSKIGAGAGITTNKLAEGADFVKRDGTVTFTGAVNLGGQRITNLASPSNSTDAVNQAYVDTQISNLNSLFDSKPSAKAATTGNIALTNPATAVFDTVTLNPTEILFVRAQTAPSENGLYTFNGSSSPLTRITQMDVWTEFPGALFTVESGGSVYGNTMWLCNVASGGTLGTTPVTFIQVNAAGLTGSNFVDKEIPTGALNGSNTTFTLTATPVAGSEHVYFNGILLDVGASNDYTISNAVITTLFAPTAADKIRVSYRK
jgi:hypothetical protein